MSDQDYQTFLSHQYHYQQARTAEDREYHAEQMERLVDKDTEE